jgi:hypothetical protein
MQLKLQGDANMDSWKTAKLLGSAVFPRAIHWHGLVTAGAMLTCMAVALNVGPFAKVPKTSLLADNVGREGVRVAETNVSHPPPAADLELRAPLAVLQSAIDVANSLQPVQASSESLPQTPPLAAVELASSQSQREWPEQQSAERQEQSPRDEPASIDSATPHPPDDANSDLVKSAMIVGVWSPNASTCSARDFREGALPAVISADGAWAGETFCMFSNKKVTDAGWSVVAKCSSPRERWTTSVRLTVKDNRLTWTSKRGSQIYSRCAPDVLMAEAR